MKPMAKTSRRKRRLRDSRRSGFTLAELLVSIGILLVMLGLVGQVMNITVQATGQATALTEVNRSLRILEQTLRDDLKSVNNGSGVLVIQGNPINAYLTQDGFDADDDPKDPLDGYPHQADPERERNDLPGFVEPPRADLLMFFTQRQRSSYVTYPTTSFAGTTPEAVRSNVQQVVYGHAYLGEYELNAGGAYDFLPYLDAFPNYPELATTPAENWHLARRIVHLLPGSNGIAEWVDYDNTTADRLGPLETTPLPANATEYRLLTGQSDVVFNFDYDDLVLKSGPNPTFFYPEIFNGRTKPFSRSFLDTSPPALLAERLGHYFIPFCTTFKVEWTFDPKASFVENRLADENQILWIDLGNLGNDPTAMAGNDPLASITRVQLEAADIGPVADFRKNNLSELLQLPLIENDTYSLENRFGEAPDPQWLASGYGDGSAANFAAFVANRGGSVDDPIRDELFPSALRITVDVYDDGKRLAKPIRHVMVIPVG